MRSRNFFGRIAIFMMVITSLLALPMTVLATNTDGAASLSTCNLANGYAGGIELFSLESQSGGSRVWCIERPPSTFVRDDDMHFGGYPSGLSDSSVTDVGSFNNKADSVRLRTNPGCLVEFYAYSGADQVGFLGKWQHPFIPQTYAQNMNVNLPNDVISSGKLVGLYCSE